MLTRLRARAIDGATMLVRVLDARRERDRLRETVDHVLDERDDAIRERDDYARLVATREVEIDELLRLCAEVDRLRKVFDWNQRSCEVSNAGNEALLRDLSALLTGSHPPLTSQDVVQRVQAVIDERDARIPTDIDGAQAWAERHGVRFERVPSWRSYSDACDWPAVGSREWAVAGAVATALRSLYGRDMQAGGDA